MHTERNRSTCKPNKYKNTASKKSIRPTCTFTEKEKTEMEDSAVFGVGSCSAVGWAGKQEDEVERETEKFMPCIFLKTANYLNGSESSLEY